ncbi:TPA: hypothetical protein ACWL6U_003173 [Morganella morganii]
MQRQKDSVVNNYVNYLSTLHGYALGKGQYLYRLVLLAEPTFPNGFWFSFNRESALCYKIFGEGHVSMNSSSYYLYELNVKNDLALIQFTGSHILKFSEFYSLFPNHDQINNDLIVSLTKNKTRLDGIFFIKDIEANNEVFLSNPEKCLEIVSVCKL